MTRLTIVLLATAAALLVAACGGDSDQSGPTPGTAASPAPTRGPIASPALCQPSGEPRPSYNVQVTARWEGEDRIVVEGSANLPGPGTVSYFLCQDGNVTPSFKLAREPTFEGGEIRAESKVEESAVGPAFDPNAHFDVVLSILGLPVQVPYFTVVVPVEGQPE